MDTEEGAPIPRAALPFKQSRPMDSHVVTEVFSRAPEAISVTTGAVGEGGGRPRVQPPSVLLGATTVMSGEELKPTFASESGIGRTKGVVAPTEGTADISDIVA